MLRDSRLTLRSHAALTPFDLQATSTSSFILRCTSFPSADLDQAYVNVGVEGEFCCDGTIDKATIFTIEVTESGKELMVNGDHTSFSFPNPPSFLQPSSDKAGFVSLIGLGPDGILQCWVGYGGFV